MFPTLFASPEDLLLALLIQPLTDAFPIQPIRILILNDPKKKLTLLIRPGSVSNTRWAQRKVAKLAGRAIAVGYQLRNLMPIELPQLLCLPPMRHAVPLNQEEQVVGLIDFPVLAVSGKLVLLDESEQRLAGLEWAKRLNFLLESVSGKYGCFGMYLGCCMDYKAIELFGD